MHPIAKTNFGVHGVVVSYYNGTSVVNGYITKQLGTIKYTVTDGTNPKTVTLAQTVAQTTISSTRPTIATIPVSGAIGGVAHGATFTATYGLDATTSVSASGAGYTNGDAIAVTGGVRAIGSVTVGTVVAGNTVTINGTVITVVASGATGPQVNVDTPTNVATALYNYASVSIATSINYAHNGAVLTCIAKVTGTSGNALTLASNSANMVVSGATLTGGTADIGTGSPAATVTVAGGVVTAVTITTAGTWLTLPSGPIFGYYATNGRMPVTLIAGFKVVSIAASGGVGYAVNDTLSFAGEVDATVPTAHVSAVSSGAASTVVVDSGGSGITTAASDITVLGVAEHVKVLYDSSVQTVEGNRYYWNLNTSVNGSAVIGKYS